MEYRHDKPLQEFFREFEAARTDVISAGGKMDEEYGVRIGIQDIVVGENLAFDLLSVRKLEEEGYCVSFENGGLNVMLNDLAGSGPNMTGSGPDLPRSGLFLPRSDTEGKTDL
uniref:Uncharacterized protein n=1 Tax=Timema poppense TaxID=170557 RepID=A0A7R9CHG1_TIMPO|nr:unnamed protein product [Timema poppensis]